MWLWLSCIFHDEVQNRSNKTNTLGTESDIINMAFRPAGHPFYRPPYLSEPQLGYGGINIFRGTAPYQSGQGFGGIFRRLFRPMLQFISEKATKEVMKKAGKKVAQEAVGGMAKAGGEALMKNVLGTKRKVASPKTKNQRPFGLSRVGRKEIKIYFTK